MGLCSLKRKSLTPTTGLRMPTKRRDCSRMKPQKGFKESCTKKKILIHEKVFQFFPGSDQKLTRKESNATLVGVPLQFLLAFSCHLSLEFYHCVCFKQFLDCNIFFLFSTTLKLISNRGIAVVMGIIELPFCCTCFPICRSIAKNLTIFEQYGLRGTLYFV